MTAKSKRAENKPKPASRKYRIKGTAGTKETDQRARAHKRSMPMHSSAQIYNTQYVSRCITCLQLRPRNSFPVCEECQDKNAKKRKGQH